MDRAAPMIVITLTVLSSGVESRARTCYFGPPAPKPDPDNPDHWMKQVMREIRERCPGKRGCSTADKGHTEPGPTTVKCATPGSLGMEDGTISDHQISASSSHSSGCCSAWVARLNGESRWKPDSGDDNPWIEVDLRKSTVISGLITQGGAGGGHVTKYKVAYQSEHSSARVYVTNGDGTIKVFYGNTDGNTLVTNQFDESVVATTVRIEPTAWSGGLRLRVELLGCRLSTYNCFVVVTASLAIFSHCRNPTMGVPYTFLFSIAGVFIGSGIFQTSSVLTGQVPQIISHTFDKLDISSPQHRVIASSVRASKMRCAADCAAAADCIQFCYEPTTRLCLLEGAADTSENPGDAGTCYKKTSKEGSAEPGPAAAECATPVPLGMQDGTISDENITASSGKDTAKNARLNGSDAWLHGNEANPWIEVDLGEKTVVSGVITQGNPNDDWRVMMYQVSYQKQHSSDRLHVTDGNGNITVFIGNNDRTSPVTNLFNESVVATTVRIEPTKWNTYADLRFELLGCRLVVKIYPFLGADNYEQNILGQNSVSTSENMDGAAPLIVIATTLTLFLSGVEGTARTCYFGPPPKPDPDNPDHWMKQVMREIRERCPGKRGRSPAEQGYTEPEPTRVHCSPRRLGMEDGTILDTKITASSYHGDHYPWAARLNGPGTWSPVRAFGSWIEVDLGETTAVSGIITQGSSYGNVVKKYKVAYCQTHNSPDRLHVTDADGNVKVFIGNTDNSTPVKNLFDESVVATAVRIEPTEWNPWVNLRLELLGCHLGLLSSGVESTARTCYFGPPPKPDPDNPEHWMEQVMREIRERCPGKRGRSPAEEGPTEPGHTTVECATPRPLGIENGTIPDSKMSASSSWHDGCCPAWAARLNNKTRWASASGDTSPWIEVDLAERTVVSGVIIQGDPWWENWVTKYKVSYQAQHSSDRIHVTGGNGNITVFIGNTDSDTPVTNLFDESVVATTVRIEPTKWHGRVYLRLELLGCRLD
ncbi:uncharacterized protein LOC110975570 [Acanthaster planci]|uniref:Uncharacterized protein LOC110975570 n=1 Tax=Acanthaster planci TaxID=133434 RepID=A0A8B7XUZ7_ACAPL|nr:uncharacterized protein LOC110975570 [Acanthaster planci]